MPPDAGYVYAMRAADTGLVKVGSSTNVEKRRGVLQTGTGELTIIATLEVPTRMRAVERHLHHLLAAHWHHGEWFTMVLTREQFLALAGEAWERAQHEPHPKPLPGTMGRPRLDTEPLEKLTFMVAPSIRERLEALTAAIQAATPVGTIDLSAVCRSALAIGLAQLEDAQRPPAPRTRKGAGHAA